MIAPEVFVFVVDDDPSMRAAVASLLRSRGQRVETFASVAEFLSSGRAGAEGCLVLDVRMPGMDGFELYDTMQAEGRDLPVVFITGFGDVETGVRAMKSGAVDFLSKPFDEGALLRAIDTAMARGAHARDQRAGRQALTAHYETLSARERQVFRRVAAGLPNKRIAAELGVSEKTVKVHRAHAMAKLHARSLADLVRTAERLPDVGDASDAARATSNGTPHSGELDSSAP